jgi:UDP-N-acetylglucosamine--N-acetylmuramyl-(pentapeptide) pyrophosphoryl-undecaprenol N-acetylglucosamine transferase
LLIRIFEKHCNMDLLEMDKKIKIIISGGGTGGHIFPAISIANAIKELRPDAEILFVGAEGRMEMERVPAAGYNIVGLPVMGFPRKPGISLVKFFINLARSMRVARRVIKHFNPDVVVGVGGYASGPILRVATKLKFPSVIQEQNSYAGVTNRLLAKRVDTICVAYEKMEKYFPAAKIVHTGNPVRKNLIGINKFKEEALAYFGLTGEKKVIVIIGGSLGARTLNESVIASLGLINDSNVDIIWQTGKYYYSEMLKRIEGKNCPNLQVQEFLTRMDLAYSVADLVISRAGAGTISELCLVGKPVVLVPSPNVAEDHQTKNAQALVEKNAAVMVADIEAKDKLFTLSLALLTDAEKMKTMSDNIAKLAKPNAASDIAKIVLKLVKEG